MLLKVYTLLIFIIPFLADPGRSAVSEQDEQPRFILIHLDSVSSNVFLSEMEAGNLPNLRDFFYPDGVIEHSITYFPSKTPVVISNIKNAGSIEETETIGWATANTKTGKFSTSPGTFLHMLGSKSRISVSNALYGFPYLDRLAWLAIVNAPDYLDEYPVLEFYWYGVDTYGHLFGKDAYIRKLHRFDRQFGKMAGRLDDDDVNVIVYTDHGMSFGEPVQDNHELDYHFGDQILQYSYPHIYLENPEEKEKIARELIEKTSFDFAFFKQNDTTVIGYHHDGKFILRENSGAISYSYQGEDHFNFYSEGYNGEFLTPEEWLDFSYSMSYPGAPEKLFTLFSNPRSGDIISLFDFDKFKYSLYTRRGNHGGFTSDDMSGPLLIRGPHLDHLYSRDYIRLQTLMDDVPEFTPNIRPDRDKHYVHSTQNFRDRINRTRISFSPKYRLRFGMDASFTQFNTMDDYGIWGKFDLYRSYLTRLWLGTGVHVEQNQAEPMFMVRHELHLRRFYLRTELNSVRDHEFSLGIRLNNFMSVETTNLNSAGIRLYF